MILATRLYDCGNWAVSASWSAPLAATSGIYFARLVRQDSDDAGWRADNSRELPLERPAAVAHAYGSLGHGRLRIALREPCASHIYFVVRDDASRSDDSCFRPPTPPGRRTTAMAGTAPTAG